MKLYIHPQTTVEHINVTNNMMVVSPPQFKGGYSDDSPQYSKDRNDGEWEEM